VVLEGNSLDHSRCEWKELEAIVAAEAVAEVAGIVGVAEVVLVVGKAVGIGVVVVVDVVGEAEYTTLGLRVEGQKAQSRIAGVQEERRGFAVEEGRIVEVVANSLVVAGEECWGLAAGAGIESIVVDTQTREGLVEGRAVEHMAGAG
jgi:hypothetical protein